eukprot:CAMPEP_0119042730 /NCGR_PEP_ID=MMETSP1177-20130426/16114_1 /TAXON_ID=2985 /ORGANISM="Ochromonas sp, Strain CCMP1899" /LENGTH=664 /DNA_ID=CAMNT_0007009715 /DNA_START=325 /DNA_END=2319 /DNA_ORIENTATION=+
MISDLMEAHVGEAHDTGKGASLSVSRPTNAAGMPLGAKEDHVTQEQFFSFIEQEIRKIDMFTKKQVREIRQVLLECEAQGTQLATSVSPNKAELINALRSQLEIAGENFLKLEKYVNMNFTGFHKILKKHDRHLPNPCKAFYTARLHDQSWVRGDYSDVMVTLSRVYEVIRGDEKVIANENEKQDFVRSTRKYWVHTEDVSRVKYVILQHLPVFLQNTMAGETDSQLVNSVYLDNLSMELYNGRLDKTPGAIALRHRWYGTGIPEIVFVERKTHRESWAGEVSVKERFIIPESRVPSLMSGTFDLQAEVKRLRDKGKSEDDIKEWHDLSSEVVQAINSKQLVPTMRTQYMRVAFQIPFDATVRVSLDTNLCMISERTKETIDGSRWFRDPKKAVPSNEITRFPHAVLEVKLQLLGEGATPPWVTDLINSGMLMEVHKFSKFIHGCAVLLPEEVRAVPYWIDDVSLAQSIRQSGAEDLLTKNGENVHFSQLLPHDAGGNIKAPRHVNTSTIVSVGEGPPRVSHDNAHTFDIGENCCERVGCDWASPSESMTNAQKMEPKVYFANERTFISWLSMAVNLSSISIAVLAFSSRNSKAFFFGMSLLPLALLFVGYALWTFLWRSEKIKTRDVSRWDDPLGPLLLTFCLIVALTVQFFIKLNDVLSHVK